ncbi:uncharacterized protein N7473_011035 [Penicillium subrubescens]|uniref:uncharacterized protein n=1 Tax=Penicillium subrubescens TaxID=1316194 RepID=UPI0025453F29|nr:uncharacterized protein N7473_011035 [Penicillium subrubescens]KAJ5884149.1 hypothetical protein N7473_011035 [Penicillium subrubescens]
MLANWDPADLPASQKREGSDWYAVFNPEVQRVLDVELVHHLNHDSVVCCVRFSRDGKYLATGCNRSAQIFDVTTGQNVATLQDENVDKDGDLYIRSVCFSPDGKYLATGAEDKQIRLWELTVPRGMHPHSGVKGGKCIRTFEGHKDFVLSVCLTPDGQWVMSGSKDRGVQFWDPVTGNAQMMLQGHKNSVISVAPAPTGNLFATGSGDMRARIWRYSTYTGR